MNCLWDGVLNILPTWLRRELGSTEAETVREIRIRLGSPPELILGNGQRWLSRNAAREDLDFCINAASRYSPWAAGSMAKGYLTAMGGHRIGICGEAVIRDGKVAGFKNLSSLCIRIARDVPGIAGKAGNLSGSILILGAPGWGKTTLLRDLIRQISQREQVCVADERGELFPPGFSRGRQTDVLLGCPKSQAILQLLRTMGPQVLAVDEITEEEDCRALAQAACCGVRLLATAHAGDLSDLKTRKLYRPLLEMELFESVLVLQKDQTYRVERMIR